MKIASKTKTTLIRLVCGLFFLLLTAGAILYQRGVFDFTFLPRAEKRPAATLPLVTLPVSTSPAGETTAPADPENNRVRFLSATEGRTLSAAVAIPRADIEALAKMIAEAEQSEGGDALFDEDEDVDLDDDDASDDDADDAA